MKVKGNVMAELLQFLRLLLDEYHVAEEDRHVIEAMFVKFAYEQINLAVFINSWMIQIAALMSGQELNKFALYKLHQLTSQHEISKN